MSGRDAAPRHETRGRTTWAGRALARIAQIKERCRDAFGLRAPDEFHQDLRYAFRSLTHTPGFTIVAIATLALGIGATTTIVSLVNAVLLRPLPFPDPDRLVVLVNTQQGRMTGFPFTSAPRLDAWREHAASVHDLAAYVIGPIVNLTAAGPPQSVVSGRVTAGFFRLFGARFVEGRAFTVDEDRPGGSHVAIVSHGLWQRQWGGDHAIIGQALSINGDTFTVVGVLDRLDARSLQPGLALLPDVWLPLQLDPHSRDDGNILLAVGRLAPGVAITVADQQAQLAANSFRQAFPGELPPEASFGVVPLKAIIVGEVRPSLLLLLGAVGLVTLIVCVNTANLMLGRASARRREFAIRMALGASGGRLTRQLLTESLVLAAAGGCAGCLIGSLGIPVLLGLQGVLVPRIGVVDPDQLLDFHVLLFTLATSTASGILFGLAPALRAAGTDIDVDLRGGTGITAGRQPHRLRTLLLVAEMSIACVLVTGSVLLIRSVAHLHAVNPGFNRSHVLTMRTALADRRFATTADAARVVDDGLARMTALPGVEAAAISLAGVPLALGGGAFGVNVLGRQMDRQYVERWDAISPRYFEVFQIRLLRGRLFTDRDDRDGQPVAIINDAMARQLWPTGDPFRDRILIGEGGGPSFDEHVPREIVGIVADVRQLGLDRLPYPGVYIPFAQTADALMAFFNRLGVSATWAIRTQRAPSALANAVRRELLDATNLPPAGIRTMDEIVQSATAPMALNMWLMTAFGVLALLLAVVGIYGIASYSVQQRTRELGVRLALGAQSRQVRNVVVWESLRVTLVGVLIGWLASVGLARGLNTLLFGVTAHDPATFTVVPMALVVAAVAGAWLPASRAARLDPLVALRGD